MCDTPHWARSVQSLRHHQAFLHTRMQAQPAAAAKYKHRWSQVSDPSRVQPRPRGRKNGALIPDSFSRRVCTSFTLEYGPDPTTVLAPILKKYRVSLSNPCTSVLKIFPDQKQVKTCHLKAIAGTAERQSWALSLAELAESLCHTLSGNRFPTPKQRCFR